ncbi:hypothetical protein [Arthrobacter sp. JSM 101049]|uniref:hypothetical protein n=1 Tax=Arthrobacter sp. JSM 101049 TaxID=929097 RepID=UPI003561C6F6
MDELDMFTEENTAEVGGGPAPAESALSRSETRVQDAHTALAQAEETLLAAQEKSEQNLTGWLRAAATEALTQSERASNGALEEVETASNALEAARRRTAGKPEDESASPVAAAPATEDAPQAFYDTAEEFLHEQLLPLYK